MPHWVYLLSAANGLVGLATWRNLPLTVVRLVGALTRDPERSKRCAEILRLARKDAKDLPSYLIDDPRPDQSPATAARRSRDKTGQQRATRSPATASGAFFRTRRGIVRGLPPGHRSTSGDPANAPAMTASNTQHRAEHPARGRLRPRRSS
jgi:hypothetical protein